MNDDVSDLSLAEIAARLVDRNPDRIAVFEGARSATRRELFESAARLGSALLRRGVSRGATISFQVPNWIEGCVVNLAAAMYGFRVNPLLMMYRETELLFMLGETRAEVLFITEEFRGTNYRELVAGIRDKLPSLKHVFVLRGAQSDAGSFESLLQETSEVLPFHPSEATAVKMVLYTSGSTGRPKGVLHSHKGMHSIIRRCAEFWAIGEKDVFFVPSPIGHIGGSIYAFEFPWITGAAAVLLDRWVPEKAVEEMARRQVTFCAGATPLLSDIVDTVEKLGLDLPEFRRFLCGGASVPPSLVERAAQALKNCVVSRAYGSTEVPLITAGVKSRSATTYGARTDGEIVCDVKIVDGKSDEVKEGEVGEILARSSDMFLGYLNPDDNRGCYDGEYFRMEDLGRRVDGRYIEITGRIKDLIIRMGENISPLEIENALALHPAVKRVAVIGVPDTRTGEAALAVVVVHHGREFSIAEMRSFLSQRGLARQKCPEYLEFVSDLPMNSVGKVQKEILRLQFAKNRTQ